MSPADAADATNDQAATAPAGEPITPTPETASYPITSYPAFQFAEPQAVAEGPSASGARAPR
jgi:hypothetical protein